ncbi:MAG: PHP domain-containing protein [Victivallales bacterium]|nr:PHP domain-containing protein [Victivallales bacterium]
MIDLHCHSTASDGSLSPTQLLQAGQRLGLKALALTDHDTLAGLAEFNQAARNMVIEAIPGIELAACEENDRNRSYHIVGLYLTGDDMRMRALLEDVIRWRQERNEQIIRRLNELGYEVTLKDAIAQSGGDVIGRPHIASALVAKGYLSDVQKGFERLLASGKPAYIRRQVPTPASAISAIHSMGGLAIWAHPFTRGHFTNLQMRRIALELKDVGLDGIEAYYSLHTPTQTRTALKIAKEFGLLVSGGSDYHGSRFKRVELGVGYGNLAVPDELLEPIRISARANHMFRPLE